MKIPIIVADSVTIFVQQLNIFLSFKVFNLFYCIEMVVHKPN